MQKIIKIARIELSILFYSPIAWLVLVIFTLQTGIAFTDILYAQETSQQLERRLPALTRALFTGEGTFKTVMENLYLYIPLLTMGLFSREISSGSIKLLLSSPITVAQIVLGKFLTMVLYAFMLVFILLTYIGVASFSVTNLDWGLVFGGILGLYLLICAYVSIGLFMSSLTAYQIVAAITTLAILAGLNFMSSVGQEYDWLRELTFWLSMGRRTESMINGLITSKDVIYFVLVISLFLILTVMRLNAGRESRSLPVKALRYIVLIALVIGLGSITSLPRLTAYFDTTRANDLTLSAEGQQMIAKIKSPVSIVTYNNILDYRASYAAPKNRIADMGTFEKYQRFIPDLKMTYVNYYDTTMYGGSKNKNLKEEAEKAAEARDINFKTLLTPAQIKQQVNLVPEENKLVRYVAFNGKKTPLRMFDDMFVYPGETEVLAAFQRLLDAPSLVGVLTGNGERSTEKTLDNSYKYIIKGTGIRGSLINQGFDVLDINLNQVDSIPNNLTTLIIADPETAYSKAEMGKITQYINAGGNLLIACEPNKQAIFNPLLDKFKVSLDEGTVLQKSEDYLPDLIQAKVSKSANNGIFSFYDEAVVTLPNVAGLTYKKTDDYKVVRLLESGENSWNRLKPFDLKNEKVLFDSNSEVKSSYPLAISLTKDFKEKQQKIIIIGDADFMSNVELQRNNITTVNGSFAIRMFKWFSDGKYPISIKKGESSENKILVNRSQINLQKLLLLVLIPILISVWGGVVILRRRRN
jgi:ABC-2 type transport system permease protein